MKGKSATARDRDAPQPTDLDERLAAGFVLRHFLTYFTHFSLSRISCPQDKADRETDTGPFLDSS
jgi:hypothetical protein